jgi:hypothetical protein
VVQAALAPSECRRPAQALCRSEVRAVRTEKLVEQLDLYANAIVGFMVAQSLAFSFTFGTNVPFSCEITKYKLLAVGLIAHFVLSTAVACWSVIAIARRMSELSAASEHPLTEQGHRTLRVAARAKGVVIALFAIIPVGLLLSFGLLGNPDVGRCAKPPAVPCECRPAA